jgi:hypothetical protein
MFQAAAEVLLLDTTLVPVIWDVFWVRACNVSTDTSVKGHRRHHLILYMPCWVAGWCACHTTQETSKIVTSTTVNPTAAVRKEDLALQTFSRRTQLTGGIRNSRKSRVLGPL